MTPEGVRNRMEGLLLLVLGAVLGLYFGEAFSNNGWLNLLILVPVGLFFLWFAAHMGAEVVTAFVGGIGLGLLARIASP